MPECVAYDIELAGVLVALLPCLCDAHGVSKGIVAEVTCLIAFAGAQKARDMVALCVVFLAGERLEICAFVYIVERIPVLADMYPAVVQAVYKLCVGVAHHADRRSCAALCGVGEHGIDSLGHISLCNRDRITRDVVTHGVALVIRIVVKGYTDAVHRAPEISVGESDVAADLTAAAYKVIDAFFIGYGRCMKIKHQVIP